MDTLFGNSERAIAFQSISALVSALKRAAPIELNRRWRLRAEEPAAYWRIYHFAPPPGEQGVYSALELHPLADLLAQPCLFLLGRPGAGKTAEFQMQLQPANLPGETVIAMEARHLAGNSPDSIVFGAEWCNALAARKPIRVVFDSVDEALLGYGPFLDGLQRRLAHAKSEAHARDLTLSLVLTCRLAEWNENVAGDIAELWGVRAEDCTYELAPLSLEAALALATHRGATDRGGFAEALSRGDMESYGCWPRTLIWMAEEYAQGGKISSTLTDLHARRCSRQFEDAEREGRLTEKLTPERIARWNAATELLACAAIATGAQRFVFDRPVGEHEFDVRAFAMALASQPESSGALVPMNAQAFRDAVQFGDLFARVGDAWVFQEQSDAEFLAARFLAQLPSEQLAEFFGSETRRGWQVYPQLATTASMAAIHSAAFRQWLLDRDPLVLLRSDFAAISEADRERAVAALLQLIDGGEAPDADDQPAHLHTLRHRKLAEQLRPWLHDARRKPEAREMALRIAAECADDELAGELTEDVWQLATDSKTAELYSMSYVIESIGVRWPKARLMAFVRGDLPSGPHWNSRGAALLASFDERRATMPVEERIKLSEVIPFFRNNPTGVRGLYDGFIFSCHKHLKVTDVDEVCSVLATLRQRRSPLDSMSPVKQLALNTLKSAVNLIPNLRAASALAEFWVMSIQANEARLPGNYHTCSLGEIGLNDREKRQCLLAIILQHPAAATLREFDLRRIPCESEDFPWLLARLPGCTGVEEKLVAQLIGGDIRNRALREENRSALDAAYAASAELRAILPPAPDGDIHAALIANEDENERRWAAETAKLARQEKKRPSYDAEKELRAAIEGCARGDRECWPLVLYAAGMFDPRNQDTQVWFATQPEDLPGWTTVPDDARAAVVWAAREFLLHHAPKLPDGNRLHLDVEAVRHALCLLRRQLATDAELRAAFRPEWPEIILRALYPLKSPLPEVLAVLHEIDAPATLASVRAKLEADWESNMYLLADHLDPLWSPALAAILVEILGHSPLQPEAYRTGLTWLMRHDRDAAASLALRRCVAHAMDAPSAGRRGAIGAALLAFPEHWRQVWPLIAADSAEGLECLSSVCLEFEHLGWRKRMFEAAEKHTELIATLYGWLLKHLPPEELHRKDPTITGINRCRDLQRACFNALLDGGQPDLLRQAFAFAGLAERPWTHRVERKSERNAHAREWRPWPLSHLAQWLTSNGGTRITDCDSLLRAVEASLRRFEQRWKGDLPLHYLWDQKARVPHREPKLSDALKDHLQQDLARRLVPRQPGLSIHREPEFYTGEKTDLFIQSPLSDGSKATIVVEVKLCDHGEVETAMDTQLATRYLRGKNLTHGIYFVGWMTCDAGPKKRTPFQRAGLAKARRSLDRQAERLSTGGLTIRALVCAFPIPNPRPLRRGKKTLRRSSSPAQ